MSGPQVFLGKETVTILFGSIPKHCIYVDIKEDKLYFDGERIMTTQAQFSYTKEKMMQKNKSVPKKRLLTWPKGDESIKTPVVFNINIGFDGRLFFLFYKKKDYVEFRSPPFQKYSYWHDRRAGEKKFYENDLHEPKKTWPVQYKKYQDVLA